METRQPSNGRATIRDVYTVVGRVEDKLDKLTETVNNQNIANEHRFTELEAQQKMNAGQEKSIQKAHMAFLSRRWQVVAVAVSCSSVVMSVLLKFVA